MRLSIPIVTSVFQYLIVCEVAASYGRRIGDGGFCLLERDLLVQYRNNIWLIVTRTGVAASVGGHSKLETFALNACGRRHRGLDRGGAIRVEGVNHLQYIITFSISLSLRFVMTAKISHSMIASGKRVAYAEFQLLDF